jgi:hypothetical protein
MLGYSVPYLQSVYSFCIVKLIHLLLRLGGHGVEGATVLEPLDLALVEGVRKLDLEILATVGGVNNLRSTLSLGPILS